MLDWERSDGWSVLQHPCTIIGTCSKKYSPNGKYTGFLYLHQDMESFTPPPLLIVSSLEVIVFSCRVRIISRSVILLFDCCYFFFRPLRFWKFHWFLLRWRFLQVFLTRHGLVIIAAYVSVFHVHFLTYSLYVGPCFWTHVYCVVKKSINNQL